MLEDTGYSTRVDAGRLDPVRRKMPENVEVERLGSGKRVDAGHQKSMTSGENRDSECGYSPGSGDRWYNQKMMLLRDAGRSQMIERRW